MTRGRRREHYQWNMDIIGVPEVTAEAELISAIVTFFKQLGITSSDVGFKVSSRKMEKIPIDEIKSDLKSAGISEKAIEELLQVLSIKSLSKLEEILGAAGDAVADLKQLFYLADKFGYSDWIQFDASVVRGLAYYTGIVFELLKEKELLPQLSPQVENIVCPLNQDLQGAASSVATILRNKGQSVDLVLENKPLKVFKRAARINAGRLILVGNSEWQKGRVSVKILATGEQYEAKLDQLV